MRKKWFQLLGTIIIAVSLTGCGNILTESSFDSEKEEDDFYTVNMVIIGKEQRDEARIETAMNKILEKEVGARIDIICLPFSTYSQQLQIMMAGNEKLDLVPVMRENAMGYISGGQIRELSGLIDSYGNNIKAVLEKDMVKVSSVGEFVYGVPIEREYFLDTAIMMRKDLVEKYHGVTAEGIVESALDKVHMIEDLGYDNLVISIKSSDVMMCVHAHELLAGKTPYPLHVGITESGTVLSGNIKSAIGLGLILNQGIGDTIRVSLTGDVVEEIKSAKLILRTLGLRKGGIEVVSCPTCGRTKIDQISLANQVEALAAQFPNLDIKVAVMGCVVNGPGEAKEADLGIAGGIGEGLLIKKGQIIRKIPEAEFIPTLRYELEHWNEQ